MIIFLEANILCDVSECDMHCPTLVRLFVEFGSEICFGGARAGVEGLGKASNAEDAGTRPFARK